MQISSIQGIKVAGIATAVPIKKENIKEKYQSTFGEKAVEKSIESTGIRFRHIVGEKQTASDLAYAAARNLLEQKQINKDDIGIIVFVSQTVDYKLPATACVLHGRLELPIDCLAFDVNLGCSGYVYGMQVIASVLQTLPCRYGLLLVGDALSTSISPEDANTAMLFGDAGSATLLEKDCKQSEIRTYFRTKGSGYSHIMIPAGASRMPSGDSTIRQMENGGCRSDYHLYMNGVEVFLFTIYEVPRMINEYLKEETVSREDFDAYIFHQANCKILKQIVKKTKLVEEKVPISMDRYGNTSVTSIPLTICDQYGTEQDSKKIRLLACGYGVGLSWGIADFEVDTIDVLPVIETDEFFQNAIELL